MKTSVRGIQRYWTLSSRQRRDLNKALVLIPVVAVALRIGRFGAVVTTLERTSRREMNMRRPIATPEEARALAEMVTLASDHGLVRGNCLHRSLVTWWLLRRRGAPAVVRLGAGRVLNQNMGFHAWVECDDQVVNDKPDIALFFAAFPIDAISRTRLHPTHIESTYPAA